MQTHPFTAQALPRLDRARRSLLFAAAALLWLFAALTARALGPPSGARLTHFLPALDALLIGAALLCRALGMATALRLVGLSTVSIGATVGFVDLSGASARLPADAWLSIGMPVGYWLAPLFLGLSFVVLSWRHETTPLHAELTHALTAILAVAVLALSVGQLAMDAFLRGLPQGRASVGYAVWFAPIVGALGALVSIWRPRARMQRVTLLPAALATLAVTIGSVLLYDTLAARETAFIEQAIGHALGETKDTVQSLIERPTEALVRQARRMERLPRVGTNQWRYEASLYTRYFPGLIAVEGLSVRRQPQWATTAPANRITPDLTAADRQAIDIAFARAARENVDTIVYFEGDARGEPGFYVIVPLQRNDRPAGFLVGVFDIEALFAPLSEPTVAPGYALSVTRAEQSLYSRPVADASSRWAMETNLVILDTRWRVQLAPGHAVVQELRSPITGIALGGGAAAALLLGWAMYLWQAARVRLGQVQDLNRGLNEHMHRREQVERDLRMSEQRFRAVAESAQDAIVMAGADGIVRFWNQAAERLFGYSAEEMQNAPLDRIVPPSLRRAHRAGMDRLNRGGEPRLMGHPVSMRALRADGSEFPVELSLSRWEQGGQYFYSALIRDMTEQQRKDVSIQRLTSELEQRVNERTLELREANMELAHEVAERRRMEERLAGRARQQAVLAEMGQRALAMTDFDALLEDALVTACSTLELDMCALLELRADRRGLLLRAGFGWSYQEVGEKVIDTDVGNHAGFTLQQNAPVVSEDLAHEKRFSTEPLIEAGAVKSGMSCVISGHRRRVGVLVGYHRSGRAFNEDEVYFLQSVANVIGLIYERSRAERERAQLLTHERSARAEADTAKNRVSDILESIADAFMALDGKFAFTYANSRAEQLLRMSRQTLLGSNIWERFPWLRQSRFERETERAFQTGVTAEFEEFFEHFGEWFEFRIYPAREGLSIYFRDVSARKHSLEALHESEMRQRLMIEAVRDYAIFMLDTNGKIASWNEGATRILGYREEEALGLELARIYQEGDENAARQEFEIARAAGRFEREGWQRRKSGERFWASTITTRLEDDSRQVIGYSRIMRDLMERKRAEEWLAAEKERLSVTLYSIADGVISTDTEGKITLANRVAEELTGMRAADLLGRPVTRVFRVIDRVTRRPVEDAAAWVLREGRARPLNVDILLLAHDGSERAIADSAAPIRDREGNMIGVVQVFRDVSAQQRMEEELRKSRNLESIGLLAGGIAHDFNNILTAILGNISLAKLHTKAGDPVFEELTHAEKAFVRAQDLTQQLLTFAKGGAPIKKTASVAELLHDTATFALRGSNVRLQLEIAPDLWQGRIDVGQISQVVNNIVINAKQAMPSGGTLTVNAHNARVEGAEQEAMALDKGRYVRIEIRDTGSGIDPKHLPHIFDPYFTTKRHGVGLGLATSYSIVRKHGGHIEVRSELGQGTTFIIYLPASDAPPVREQRGEMRAGGGQGKILLMDDEDQIRRVAGTLLQRLGYEVGFAASGEEAIERYTAAQAEGKPFDLVILDLTIPGGMGGRECLEALKRLDPNVRAVVSSGYSNDPVMADFRRYGFDGVVAKPYRLQQLTGALQEILAARNNGTS